MRKRRNRWIALMSAFILLGLTVRMETAYGAVGIETDKKCSITFDLSSNYQKGEGQDSEEADYVKGNGYGELSTLEIPVDLYKVADVEVNGKYKKAVVNQDLYSALETELKKVDSNTTAAAWMSMAKTAAEKIKEDSSKISVTLNQTNSEGIKEENNVKDLNTGLYLVAAQEVTSSEYIYTFDPYLVSLPGSSYYSNGDDTWIYDVTVGLKASQANRYGDLEIVKTLNAYNATLGGATFIFQIEAEKDGKSVYSDVVSLVFDNAGTRSVKIEGKIPAGAVVTVTEVYTGASYELKSDRMRTETIIADKTVSVSFVNDYDERLNGGTSVVNHFSAAGNGSLPEEAKAAENSIVWDVEQLNDSTSQAERSGDDE